MSWMETWLDTAVAPPLQAILNSLDGAGAQGINFYLGGRYLYGPAHGTWTLQLALDLEAARPSMSIFGSWVSLQPGQGGYGLGYQDGQDAAYTAQGYPLQWLSYDVEPSVFDANPGGAADAMRGFTDAVHAAGFKSMPYSVPRGLAAGSQNADGIWIANPNPGGEDPAIQPLNAAFFPGLRSVQCCSGTWAGVDWDVSHSQFTLGAATTGELFSVTAEQQINEIWNVLFNYDGNGAKALFTGGPQPLGDMVGQVHALLGAGVGYGGQDTPATAWLKLKLQEIENKVAAAVDVNALAAALAAHPLTASLTDAERDTVAAHVLQHLSKDTAAG